MNRLRRLLAALRPPHCPLCWCRPADLAVHLRTAHTDVELRQYMEGVWR